LLYYVAHKGKYEIRELRTKTSVAQIISKPEKMHAEKSSMYCVPQNVITSTRGKLIFLDT